MCVDGVGGCIYIYNSVGCSKKQQHYYYYSPSVYYSLEWLFVCELVGGGGGGVRKTSSVLCAMGSKLGVGIARDWGGLY